MKFCSYTNFDALFLYVVTDFPFLRLNQSFAIAKFVYLNPVAVDLGYLLIRTFVISMSNKFPAIPL